MLRFCLCCIDIFIVKIISLQLQPSLEYGCKISKHIFISGGPPSKMFVGVHWCYPISMVVASQIVQTLINILVLFAGSAQVFKQIILAFLGLMFGRSLMIGRGGDRREGGGGGGGGGRHDSLRWRERRRLVSRIVTNCHGTGVTCMSCPACPVALAPTRTLEIGFMPWTFFGSLLW